MFRVRATAIAMAPSMALKMPLEQSCRVLSRSKSHTGCGGPSRLVSRRGRCSATALRKGRTDSAEADHGAHALVRQDLEQQAVGHAAVHHVYGSHAIARGIQC